jgi:hypothetical protein
MLTLTLAGLASSALAQDSGTPVASPAASPVASTTFTIGGEATTPLTLSAADLAAMTTQDATVSFASGSGDQTHTEKGPLWWDLNRKAGVKDDGKGKNPSLRWYVLITANDGYQLIIAGADHDPSFGNAPILVSYEEDGQQIAGAKGPVPIVAPGDKKGGRSVSGVSTIEVRMLSSAPINELPVGSPSSDPGASLKWKCRETELARASRSR